MLQCVKSEGKILKMCRKLTNDSSRIGRKSTGNAKMSRNYSFIKQWFLKLHLWSNWWEKILVYAFIRAVVVYADDSLISRLSNVGRKLAYCILLFNWGVLSPSELIQSHPSSMSCFFGMRWKLRVAEQKVRVGQLKITLESTKEQDSGGACL